MESNYSIDKFTLINYKGLENISMPLDKTFNIIIGENSIGKTRLLEGIKELKSFKMKIVFPENMFENYDFITDKIEVNLTDSGVDVVTGLSKLSEIELGLEKKFDIIKDSFIKTLNDKTLKMIKILKELNHYKRISDPIYWIERNLERLEENDSSRLVYSKGYIRNVGLYIHEVELNRAELYDSLLDSFDLENMHLPEKTKTKIEEKAIDLGAKELMLFKLNNELFNLIKNTNSKIDVVNDEAKMVSKFYNIFDYSLESGVHRIFELINQKHCLSQFEMICPEHIEKYVSKILSITKGKKFHSTGEKWLIEFINIINRHENKTLLIDEPGVYISPVQRQKLLKVMEEIAKEKNLKYVYTTHSPFMIPEINVNILLLSKNENGVIGKDIDVELLATLPIFSDIIFEYSRVIVLCEGKNDVFFHRNVLKSLGVDLNLYKFIDCGGWNNIKNLLESIGSLLNSNILRVVAIVDEDKKDKFVGFRTDNMIYFGDGSNTQCKNAIEEYIKKWGIESDLALLSLEGKLKEHLISSYFENDGLSEQLKEALVKEYGRGNLMERKCRVS